MKKILVVDFWRSPHLFNFVNAYDGKFELFYANPITFSSKWWLYSLFNKLFKGTLLRQLNKRLIHNNEVRILSNFRLSRLLLEYLNRKTNHSFQSILNYLIRISGNSFNNYVMTIIEKSNYDLIIFSAYPLFLENINYSNSKIIIDVAGATDNFILHQLTRLINKYTEFNSLYEEYKTLCLNPKIIFSLNHNYLVPSDYVKTSLLNEGINKSQISLLRYPVPSKIKLINRRNVQQPLSAIYAGRISYLKGLSILTRAARLIDKNQIVFNLYGKKIDNIDLPENFIHHGFIDNNKYIEDLVNYDIYVHPSITEGMSYSVLEAMASGMVVICSSNSGFSDIINNNENGFIYNFDSHQELANIIQFLIDNPQLLSLISENAMKTVASLNIQNYKDSLMRLIDEKINI